MKEEKAAEPTGWVGGDPIDGLIFDNTGSIKYAIIDSGGWLKSRRFLLPPEQIESEHTTTRECQYGSCHMVLCNESPDGTGLCGSRAHGHGWAESSCFYFRRGRSNLFGRRLINVCILGPLRRSGYQTRNLRPKPFVTLVESRRLRCRL